MGHRKDITPGRWRAGNKPMQVISGAIGHVRIHFEAPPSGIVPLEMKRFIKWFNESAPGSEREIIKAPIRSAIAHLWFESIHPFEDGNGRIGRVIAEKALSQGIGRPLLLSLSKVIEPDRKEYYSELKKAQRSLEITSWINYFVRTVLNAQKEAEDEIEFTLKKVKFFDRFINLLNARQSTVLKRMLGEGAKCFQGGMNARKYAGICKVSKATATRDLQYLAAIEALVVTGGGRSTSYRVNF
jgi:Fic family protein